MHSTYIEYARVLAEFHNITVTEALSIISDVLEIANKTAMEN